MTLRMQLLDFKKQLADLEATEQSVSEAERQVHEATKRAKQLRATFAAARESLEEKISDLEKSSEEQDQLDEELCQKRVQAHEDKLPEFERVKASFKSQQEQFANLINSLNHLALNPNRAVCSLLMDLAIGFFFPSF
ncbi:hypothetical protein RchiOBHm_Chr1g0356361 [Rosa chinensis]|uniref:Uncharacterized protein n=1 Tax=Rosa chinensis TaxID=74649 RepID=A0A2P6SHL6_ROSCH|nr:hypothetical protein RchiOBHm_Chr1g0356361 [Rosa chinensis]